MTLQDTPSLPLGMRRVLTATLLAQFVTGTAAEIQTESLASWLHTEEALTHKSRDHSHNLHHRSHHFLNFASHRQETRLQKAEEELLAAQEADAKDRPKHAPFFDAFLFIYWGIVAVITGLIAMLMNKQVEAEVPLREDEEPNAKQLKRRMSVAEYILGSPGAPHEHLENQEQEDDDEDEDEGEELPHNTWALILIASIGQAKFSNGRPIPAWLVCVVAIFMGFIQMAALFLMCHDLDPTSEPLTVQPSTPYGSVWSVNSMKVIMTIFMVVALVSEAGQCQKVFCQAMAVHESRLTAPRWVPMIMEVMQYLIAIAVVWAGVSVILSFQAVPDIIYSSMSIMCISNVDEMFFECMDAVLGIEADFVVKECTCEKVRCSKGSAEELAMRADGDFHYELAGSVNFAMKFLLAFPVLFGVFLFLRAWYTGFMPTDRIHTMMEMFA